MATGHPDRLIFRLWRGEVRLWQAFWLLWVAGGFAVGAVTVFLMLAGLFSIFMILLTRMAFMVYAGVAVWRSAFNCQYLIWGWLARICLVVSLIVLILSFFDMVRLFGNTT